MLYDAYRILYNTLTTKKKQTVQDTPLGTVKFLMHKLVYYILIEFSLTVKEATLIFISGRASAISCAKEGFLGRKRARISCKS